MTTHADEARRIVKTDCTEPTCTGGGPHLPLVKEIAAALAAAERAGIERLAREPVRWFAAEMEKKLAKHDHDRGPRGWHDADRWSLLSGLEEEFGELTDAIRDGGDVIAECADMANFAMMIADRTRALLPAAGAEPCAHEWVNARNVEQGGPVESGWYCGKCGAVRAIPAEPAAKCATCGGSGSIQGPCPDKVSGKGMYAAPRISCAVYHAIPCPSCAGGAR